MRHNYNNYARGGPVRRGYAYGGEVEDDAYYQPDELQRIRASDDYGYQDPALDRSRAARTGYWPEDDTPTWSSGGRGEQAFADIEAEQQRPEPRTGYSEPEPQQDGPSMLQQSLDWLHKQFGIGSAQAADNPPQTGYDTAAPPDRAAEWAVKPTPEPYKPTAGGSGTIEGMVPAVTPGVATTDPSSPLGRVKRAPTVSPADVGVGVLSPFNPQRIEMERQEEAKGQQFQGTEGWLGGKISDVQEGLAKLINGDRPYTLPQVEELSKRMLQNPNVDYDPAWQKTFDEAVRTKGAAGGAEVIQAARPFYERLNSLSHAALQNNDLENAAKFADKAHDLLPNNTKQTTTFDRQNGMFTAVLTKPDGTASTFQLNPEQFYKWRAGNASQFDHVVAGGTERALQLITGIGRDPNAKPEAAAAGAVTPAGQAAQGQPAVSGPQGNIRTYAGRESGSGPTQKDALIATGQVPLGIDYHGAVAGTGKPMYEVYKEINQKRGTPIDETPRLDPLMRYNVEKNVGGLPPPAIRAQEILDKVPKPYIKQNVPVDKLSPQDIYTERQQLMPGSARGDAAAQQFQQRVAPGRAYPTDEQRAKTAAPGTAGGSGTVRGMAPPTTPAAAPAAAPAQQSAPEHRTAMNPMGMAPPPAAVQALRANPTPATIMKFELIFGPGSARRLLGQ